MLHLQARIFSQSVIWRALSNGLVTSACRGSAPSSTSVWRSPLQSTSLLRLWTARLVSCIQEIRRLNLILNNPLAIQHISTGWILISLLLSHTAVQTCPQVQTRDQAGEKEEATGTCWAESSWEGRCSYQEAPCSACRLVIVSLLY